MPDEPQEDLQAMDAVPTTETNKLMVDAVSEALRDSDTKDGASETVDQFSPSCSQKSTRKKSRRRRRTTDDGALRLMGRRSLCLGAEQIAPKMMRTVKNRILLTYLESKRGFDENELTQIMIRDSKKPVSKDRVLKNFHGIEADTNLRNLKEIILQVILLQEETYSLEERRLDEKVLEYEKNVIKESKQLDLFDPKKHDAARIRSCDIYKTVLEAAWRRRNDISEDEANLLKELRNKLGVSSEDHRLLSAHLKRFPKDGCKLHTPEEIHEARKELQRQGLLWGYRDENKGDIDVIPLEIALILREDLQIELQKVNFLRLLSHEYITVADLREILKRFQMDPYGPKEELISRIAESDVPPKEVLAALDRAKLSDMSRSLELKSSGAKEELITQLIDFYDDLSFEERDTQDEREDWFNNYELLASRKHADLRAKKLIAKELEVDTHFEKATDFLFEELLNLKIDVRRTVTKADGRIIVDGRQVILWDCKTCETEVNLQDFLESQFQGYLEEERNKGFLPLAFLVVGPAFTANSVQLAHKFKAKTNWDVALMQADALKKIAEHWSDSGQERPFPVGLFNQTGLIDKDRADYLLSLT